MLEGPRHWGGRRLGLLGRLLGSNSSYRRLFLGYGSSLLGNWLSFVPASTLIYVITGSQGSSAVVLAAYMLPGIVVSPLAGAMADRIDRRRMLMASALLRVPAALGLAGAAMLQSAWLVLACVVLMSALQAVGEPINNATLPNIVPARELGAAQALFGGLYGVMLFVGAALGGVFAGTIGRDGTFVASAAMFMLAAWLVSRISAPLRAHRASTAAMANAPLRQGRKRLQAVFGLAEMGKSPWVFFLAKGGTGVSGGIIGLLPIYALERFEGGDIAVGVLLAARGMGAFMGPFVAHALVRGEQRRHVLVCGMAIVLHGLAYVIFSLTGSLLLATTFVLVAHAGGGAQWVLSTYGLQLTTPDEVRGKVMGSNYSYAMLSIGASSLIASVAANAFGIFWTTRALAGLTLLFGIAWLMWARELWLPSAAGP